MADLEDDSILRTAKLTLNEADLRVASSLKEGAYRISRRIFRGSTYYLTRHDMDVEASLLNEKSNAQIVSPFNCFFGLVFPFTIHYNHTVEYQTAH